MAAYFNNLYKSFGNQNVKIKDVLKPTSKLKSGFFYSIVQNKETNDVFNCNPICIVIGVSERDHDCYNIIDLCYLPKNIRYKFVELFFNTYKEQINKILVDSDRYPDLSNFNLRCIQSFLKVFNISHAITKINLKDIKKINVIDFIDVITILDDIDN